MTIRMTPYLNFDGNTREAMEYYHDIFGGRLVVLDFAQFGIADMPPDGVMHAALMTDDFHLYASDAMPGAAHTWQGSRTYISLMGDDESQLTAWFARLADGGNVGTPLTKQLWGDHFGQVTDRYGIEWMVNISAPGGAPQS